MRIDAVASINSYQASMSAYNQQDLSFETETARKTTDSIEISAAGRAAVEAMKTGSEKSYDINKVMEIHKKGFTEIPTSEESDYYWAARKSDPELDRALYDMDKAEVMKLQGKVQNILLKAASGQPLNAEERQMLKEDPTLQLEYEKRQTEANFINQLNI